MNKQKSFATLCLGLMRIRTCLCILSEKHDMKINQVMVCVGIGSTCGDKLITLPLPLTSSKFASYPSALQVSYQRTEITKRIVWLPAFFSHQRTEITKRIVWLPLSCRIDTFLRCETANLYSRPCITDQRTVHNFLRANISILSISDQRNTSIHFFEQIMFQSYSCHGQRNRYKFLRANHFNRIQ